MAKTVDLRTYLLLERAFVRRLQRAWRIQSAPLYARITQACLDHKWDEARRLVTFLDMTEVGTQNREWITYMLLSFATFGAQTVAKKKPSFVGVGTFDTFLKQVTNNIIQYLEFTATATIQEDALHLIATDEAHTKAQKRDYVRDEQGRFAATFKAWFGQSKVVDRQGNPLVMYHGTNASVDFEEFTKTQELGYHFGTAQQANYRTTDYTGHIIPAYLSIQNPIRMDDFVWDTAETATKWAVEHGFDPDGVIQREHEAHTTAVAEAAEALNDAITGLSSSIWVLERAYAERKREHRKAIFRLFKAALEAKGYDGIVYENEAEGAGDSYIAFYSHQIKSAIGNIGAFDPKDPRITKWEESEHPRDRAGKFTDSSDAMLNVTLPVVNPELATIRLKVVRQLADEVAHQMGFDPSRIDVVDEEAKGFSVGEKQFTEAGHFDPATGRIYLNSANITYDETPLVKGVISHEISHAIFHELKEASKVEEQAFLKKAMTPTDQYSDWYLERFSLQKGPSGRTERRPKPEYLEELVQDYPASTVLAALGDGYFKGISRKMVEENGHSEYAKTYWDPKALEGRDVNQKYDHAITETIAEITRYVTKSGWYEMTKPSPDSPWVKLTVAMHQWYQNRPGAA